MYMQAEKAIYNEIKRMMDNRMNNNTIIQKNEDQGKRQFGTNKVTKKTNVNVIEPSNVFLVLDFRTKRGRS